MSNLSVFRPSSIFSDDFFKSFFDDRLAGMGYSGIEMYDKDGKTHVKLEMPGYKKENIEVNVEDNRLVISAKAEESEEKQDEGKKYYYKSASKRSFSQQIALPHKVNEDGIVAKYDGGYLQLEIPHAEAKEAKKITIA